MSVDEPQPDGGGPDDLSPRVSASPAGDEHPAEDSPSTASTALPGGPGAAVTPDAPAASGRKRRSRSLNMLPAREGRPLGLERLFVRLIATCGVVGIGVAIAAIMVSNKSQGWLVGVVVSIVTVVLSAILWSSRQL